MMKFSIVSRGDDTSEQIKDHLQQSLLTHNQIYHAERPDIVITVGGDGTLLEAFHRYVHRLDGTAFVGVHTGHLGFYADWRPGEVEKLIDYIIRQPIQTVSYPLVELVIYHHEDCTERYLALNECTIKTAEGSVVMDIEINDHPFETFRGDGLCISTPSGSTAYNKSLNGAIIHPSLSAMQLTEMASINNRVYRTIGSPLILPDHHTLTLKPGKERGYQITVDHHSFLDQDVQRLVFRVSSEKVRFARYQRFPFWHRVKESFVDES